MSDGTLLIDDGFTMTDHLPAAPGLHPAAVLVYRPALAKERNVYQSKLSTKDPDVVDKYECDLIARQAESCNDAPLRGDREKARRLHPVVRGHLIDLILSITPAREAEVEGN